MWEWVLRWSNLFWFRLWWWDIRGRTPTRINDRYRWLMGLRWIWAWLNPRCTSVTDRCSLTYPMRDSSTPTTMRSIEFLWWLTKMVTIRYFNIGEFRYRYRIERIRTSGISRLPQLCWTKECFWSINRTRS